MAGDEQAAATARRLIDQAHSAALGTLDHDGGPFVSHVITARAPDGSLALLLSRLAWHSRNLERDSRASLLLVEEPVEGSETMAATRLTLLGRVAKDENPDLRAAFLARHPDATGYAGFADFGFYRFFIGSGHLVAGFGRIVTLPAADLIARPDS